MLGSLASEVTKIDRLLDSNFAKKKIIIPAIEYAHARERITTLEMNMLLVCVEKDVVSASDFKYLFPNSVSRVNISHAVKRLRENRLIEPIDENACKYNLLMSRNNLTFAILRKLDENGFLPPMPDTISSPAQKAAR